MKRSSKRLQILLAVTLLLYACGYLTQFIGNYAVWQKNGGMPGGTSPPFPSLSPPDCLKGILWFPYNLYCIAGCAATVAAIFLYRKLFSQDALTDSERNFDFSAKGTYGTSGWMQPREIPAVLDMVSDLSQHTGTVLGMLDGKFLCIPEKTRMNGNLAVYGASGSMKTRSFCMNRILQSAVRGESLIICDPKSELYEKSSEYMRDLGYTVRVFNLVSPENSDSWNCLKEIEGQELMAQLFVDAGYVVRTRVRDERGCLRGCDYYVYEYPQTPSSGSGGSAESVPPMLEPLASDSAVLGNPMQLNKEIQNKEKQNTDLILSEGAAVRTKVRDNIELDLLCRNQPESAPVMQEIYELVVETIQLRSPVLRLGNNLFPMALVRERLLQLTSEHIRFVLDGLCNLHTDVKNLKKYLLTMLFNAPVTLNGRTMLDVRKSVGGGSRPMLA